MRVVKLATDFIRAVYSTDYHVTDTPPGRRAPTYSDEILAKIKFAGETAKRISAVSWCGGDVFHSKSPNAKGNTFSLANRLIDTIHESHPQEKLYGVHGNHDIVADRPESLPQQPLGTLIAAGVFEDLSNGSVIFENADGSVRVQVDAYPYADDMVTLDRVLNAPPREPGVNYRVVLMHQYGNPGDQGSLFGHPTIGYNQMAECDYDVALWGHDHSRAETVTVGHCTHIRLGSLSRASLAMDEVDRPVALAVLTFTATRIGFKEVEVPVLPLEIAFTVADKKVERVNQQTEEILQFFKEMDAAVDQVQSDDPRIVLRELCPAEEPELYDLAVELCGF